ncbi:MAG: DRTGG domain-containing protein [Chloroflexota bacterium]
MGVLYVAGAVEGAGASTVAAGLAAALRAAGHQATLASADAVSGPLTVVDGLLLGADSAAEAQRLDARVVGVLPHARDLEADAGALWREVYGERLAGLVLNRITVNAQEDAASRLVPALEAAGVPVLAALAEDRLLGAPTVRSVVEALGATLYAGEEGLEGLVEHLLIGGLITEWGGNYFGRHSHQAVLVRGGRMDIQMSALNFPLSALVLTGAEVPAQYVLQRAEAQEVPLAVTGKGTTEAAEALAALAPAPVAHPDKTGRAAALLAGAVGPALLSAAGVA